MRDKTKRKLRSKLNLHVGAVYESALDSGTHAPDGPGSQVTSRSAGDKGKEGGEGRSTLHRRGEGPSIGAKNEKNYQNHETKRLLMLHEAQQSFRGQRR